MRSVVVMIGTMSQIIEFTVLPIMFGGLYAAILIALWHRKPSVAGAGQRHQAAGHAVHRIGHRGTGSVITARQIPGYRRARVNPLALITLVLGLTVPPLAIGFGHAARAQMRVSGERGAAAALTGLVLGYLTLVAIGLLAFMIVAASYA